MNKKCENIFKWEWSSCLYKLNITLILLRLLSLGAQLILTPYVFPDIIKLL